MPPYVKPLMRLGNATHCLCWNYLFPAFSYILGSKAYTNNESTREGQQLQIWLRSSEGARPGGYHSLVWRGLHLRV
jgi:hypothetical protein